MTTRTRYFVIVSLRCSASAWAPGWWPTTSGSPPARSAARAARRARLRAARRLAVAFANVHEIMTSELRQKVRRALPMQENGQREFENQTGINIETDIDRVVACLYPPIGAGATKGTGMVLARGRFDEVRIEALMREHGATRRDLQRQADGACGSLVRRPRSRQRPADNSDARPRSSHSFAVSFMEPGLVAAGQHVSRPLRDRPPSRRQQPAAGPRKRHRQRGADEPGALARRRQRLGGWPLRRAGVARAAARRRVEPDAGHHLGLGQRPRERRHPRPHSRRGARRRGREQPARRRPRLPGARQAAVRLAAGAAD